MTNFVRILFLVPPFLLFFQYSSAQIQGKIERLADEITYQVSVIPTVDWSPPQSITNNAQITLRAPLGAATINNFQTVTGNWDLSTQIDGPAEAPDFSYYSFALTAPISDAAYLSSQELILFSFEFAGDCVPFELFDNENDPFSPPNSMSLNIGNVFTILGSGPGVNAYEDNSDFDEVECEVSPDLEVSLNAEFPNLPCFGDVSSIFIKVIGGVEPYQIAWENLDNGDTGNSEITDFEGDIDLENFIGGLYHFSVIDSEGSEFEMNYEIKEPDPIDFEISVLPANCQGSADGSATILNLAGGTVSGAYQILWDSSPSNNSAFEGNLNPGNFSVTVSDDNNCELAENFEIEANAVLEVEMEVEAEKCFGENSGSFELTGVGTNQPFFFEWNNGNQNGVGATAENLTPDTYYITATDATGVCQHFDSLIINAAEELVLDYSLEGLSCDGNSLATIFVNSVENASLPILTSADGSNFSEKLDLLATPDEYFTLFIKDGKGCEITEEIYIPTNEPIYLEIQKEFAVNLGDSIKLEIFTNRENLQFEWLPNKYLSCADCPNPRAKPLESMTYRVIARDTVGCEAEARTSLVVDKDREVFFPNAISPNRDGENDIFTVYAKANVAAIKSLRILNRWGSVLFQSANNFAPNNPGEGWNGTFKGRVVDAGTYIYECEVEFQDGIVETYFGTVSVVK